MNFVSIHQIKQFMMAVIADAEDGFVRQLGEMLMLPEHNIGKPAARKHADTVGKTTIYLAYGEDKRALKAAEQLLAYEEKRKALKSQKNRPLTWTYYAQGALAVLDHFITPERAFYGEAEDFDALPLSPFARQSLLDKSMDEPNKILGDCDRLGMRIMTYQDADYPQRLRQIDVPPAVLYIMGKAFHFDEEPAIAVVGMRKSSQAGQARADAAALLEAHPEINVLLAFNEPTSVGAAQAVRDAGRSEDLFFVGFDSNVATIEGLQDGYVDALIVQNPYAMGYLGVESAYRLLSGQGGSLEPMVDTSTQIVNRENLFTIDSQKALFAFERFEK